LKADREKAPSCCQLLRRTREQRHRIDWARYTAAHPGLDNWACASFEQYNLADIAAVH
jgi:hypothetical protein